MLHHRATTPVCLIISPVCAIVATIVSTLALDSHGHSTTGPPSVYHQRSFTFWCGADDLTGSSSTSAVERREKAFRH